MPSQCHSAYPATSDLVDDSGPTRSGGLLQHDDHSRIRVFSKHLKDEQSRLRILSSLRWTPEFEERFRAQTGKPKATSTHYRYESARSEKQNSEFETRLERLHKYNDKFVSRSSQDTSNLFRTILEDVTAADHLMRALGREKFGHHSNRLFGSLSNPNGTETTTIGIARKFSESLGALGDDKIEALQPKVLPAEALAQILRERLKESHLIKPVEIRVVDELTADAAAGSHYVKLKSSAKFSLRDADVLLYHEIFTHVVTSLNGQSQTTAKWLGIDTPRITSTQEGLAVFLEIYAGKTYPRRLRKIVDRIICLQMITKGDHCGHIYDWLRDRGYNHRDTMSLIIRAFRGMEPGSKHPFTKDLTYLDGLINVFNFLKVNLNHSRHDRIEMLFAGKLDLKDVPALCRLRDAGIVEAPRWVPPQFRNLDALVTWFSCIFAFGSLENSTVQSIYNA